MSKELLVLPKTFWSLASQVTVSVSLKQRKKEIFTGVAALRLVPGQLNMQDTFRALTLKLKRQCQEAGL